MFNKSMIVGLSMVMAIPFTANAEPLPSDCPSDEFFLTLHVQVAEQTIVALDRMRDDYHWREANDISNQGTIRTYASMFNHLWDVVTDSQWWLLGKNCRE